MANVWPPFNNIAAAASANVTVNSQTEVDITGATITLVPKVDTYLLLWLKATIEHAEILAARLFNQDNVILRIRRTTPNAAVVGQGAVRCPDGGRWLTTHMLMAGVAMAAGVTHTYKVTARVDTLVSSSYRVRSDAQTDGLSGTILFATGLPADGQAF